MSRRRARAARAATVALALRRPRGVRRDRPRRSPRPGSTGSRSRPRARLPTDFVTRRRQPVVPAGAGHPLDLRPLHGHRVPDAHGHGARPTRIGSTASTPRPCAGRCAARAGRTSTLAVRWYAEDTAGNVWWFGQRVAPQRTSAWTCWRPSSWAAGRNGAEAGLVVSRRASGRRRLRQRLPARRGREPLDRGLGRRHGRPADPDLPRHAWPPTTSARSSRPARSSRSTPAGIGLVAPADHARRSASSCRWSAYAGP